MDARELLADKLTTAAGIAATADDDYLTPLERVHAIRRLAETVESALRTAVADARADGASWGQIGTGLGVTRQAAQQRYGQE